MPAGESALGKYKVLRHLRCPGNSRSAQHARYGAAVDGSGRAVVKQGQGDWIRTLINFPARYAEIEQWENEMRKNPTNADYAILKNRTMGETRALTLTELRKKFERGEIGKISKLDELSSCVVCGIGG